MAPWTSASQYGHTRQLGSMGLPARGAGGAQPAAARGAHEIVVAHRRLAERAARFFAQALLHHLHLELLFATIGEQRRRPHDGVDDEAQRPEHEAGEHADREDDLVVDAPPSVLEHPVGAGQPEDDEQEVEQESDEVPRRRLEEVQGRLERIGVAARGRGEDPVRQRLLLRSASTTTHTASRRDGDRSRTR